MHMQVHADVIKKFYLFLSILILISQFSTISSLLFMRSEPRAITLITDDDSNFAIEKGIQADFIGDNFSRSYGPFYYRLSTIMRYFNINSYTEHYTEKDMLEERSVFFHLMLISLLAVYALSFLTVHVLTKDWFWRLLGTCILTGFILSNPVRSNLLFIAKPEHLMALVCTLAVFFSVKWFSDNNRKSFLICVAFWAISFSTKAIALHLFIGFLIVVFWHNKNERTQNFKEVFKWLLIFYFSIGFWQNFDVAGTISYLFNHSKNSSIVDKSFLLNDWLPLIFNDLKWQVLGLLIITLFFPIRECLFDRKSIFYLLIIATTGLFFLLSQKTRNPHDWYTFPFVSVILLLLATCLTYLVNRFDFVKFSSFKLSIYYPIFVLSIVPWITPTLPKTIFESYKTYTVCRPEGRELFLKVDLLLSESNFEMLVDPVIPFPRKYNDKKVFMTYEMKLEKLKNHKLKYLALRNSYYMQYLNKDLNSRDSNITYVADQDSTQSFYRLFLNKKFAQDPFGSSWAKIYQDDCGNEIWSRN